MWAEVAIFALGIADAFYLKANDRAKYETVGCLINDGLDSGAWRSNEPAHQRAPALSTTKREGLLSAA